MNLNKLKITLFALLSVSLLVGCGTHSISSSVSSDSFSSGSESIYNVSFSTESSLDDSSNLSSSTIIEKTNIDELYGGYYKGFGSWNNGEELKEKLYQRIRNGYNPLPYADPNWETNQNADQAIDDLECLDVVYSDLNVIKSDTNKSWQREHAFCASLMTGFTTGEVTSSLGRATDFHNLFASYSSGNTSRGNKNYGVADPNASGYQNVEGNDYNNGDYKCDSKNFEPNDYDKGRLARAIFYMGVMYSKPEQATVRISSGTSSVSYNVTYPGLTIIDGYVNYWKVSYDKFVDPTSEEYNYVPSYYSRDIDGYVAYSLENCQYAIGNLYTLLEWNNKPVDRLEYQHNESVYSHVYSKSKVAQGNRNPFVDFPGLVDYVFGNKQNQKGSLEDLISSYDSLESTKKTLSHLAIKTAKRVYSAGETFTTADYDLIGVNKDGSTYDEDEIATSSSYTFTEEDAKNGTKVLKLNTYPNNIKYSVKVTSATIVSADYSHNFVKTDFKDSKITTTPTLVNNMDGVNWLVSGKNEVTVTKASGIDAVSIGKSTGAVSELVLETQEDFIYQGKNKIKGVYLQCNPASGLTYKLNITIGNYVSFGNDIVYTKPNPDYQIYGISLDTPYVGKIKIVVSNITAAFNLMSIAVKLEA